MSTEADFVVWQPIWLGPAADEYRWFSVEYFDENHWQRMAVSADTRGSRGKVQILEEWSEHHDDGQTYLFVHWKNLDQYYGARVRFKAIIMPNR
jgi:hypothetical protein